MAYINFKEETAVAIKELQKRNENNIKILKQIKERGDSIKIVADEKYSYRVFNKRTFNTAKTVKQDEFLEVSNLNVVASQFKNCKFYNIKFRECNFIGCSFTECDFGGGGTIFENCSFLMEESISVPSLNVKDNLSCSFINCKIYCKFTCCNLSYLIIEDSYLKNTSFELSDMVNIIIINSRLKKIDIVDVDLSGANILKSYIEDLEFNDKLNSKINEKTFIDKIKLYKNTREEYEGLYMVYETLANKFKENNLNNNFGEYYYLCRKMQRKTLKPIPKISSYIYWATSGYGERILYSLVCSIILIIIFAVIYLIVGIELDGSVISYGFNSGIPKNFQGFINDFNEALNLSVGMFAAVGVNKSMPTSESYMISNIEIIIGVVMGGIGIGTLTRKLIR